VKRADVLTDHPERSTRKNSDVRRALSAQSQHLQPAGPGEESMRKVLGALALLMALFTPVGAIAAQQVTCDRTCLNGMLDRLLASVIAEDPSRAPLAIGFRQTQNSVLTPVRGGVWKTLTALGSVQRRYLDPVTGNAEFFGIVTDAGEPAVASVRIHVDGGRITEGEWHIAHKGDPGINGKGSNVLFDLNTLAANPPPQRTVPKSQRLPRDTLIAIVNSYFDGLTAGNGRTVIAHGGRRRFENGF
jgi:hypothetical protein